MREYELTVLINPDLESPDAALDVVRGIVTDNGGEVTAEDNQGKQRLAYRIDGHDFATYVYMDVRLPAEGVRRVDSTLNITDEVIRHLLVSVDPKAKTYLAEAAKRRAERGEDDEAESDERSDRRPRRSDRRDS